MRSAFEETYKQLGIQPLPLTVERQQQIQSQLEQLSREACYTDAIVGLGRLEEALILSNKANSYFGQQGDERIRTYAANQKRDGGIEFIIFGTIRARLLFEKALIDKRTRESLTGECRDICSLLSRKRPNEIRIGTVERSRQLILADMDALGNRRKKSPTRYAFSEIRLRKERATCSTEQCQFEERPSSAFGDRSDRFRSFSAYASGENDSLR